MAGGFALISTYTRTGNRSSAPGGSPQRAYWSRLIRMRRLCTMQCSLPRGDWEREGRERKGGREGGRERRERREREREGGRERERERERERGGGKRK